MIKTIACLLLTSSSAALAADAPAPRPMPTPPATFAGLVPTVFENGLQLVGIAPRCNGCAPWRVVDFRSNDSPDPIRREQVSVADGVTAMYAFPGTAYFANVKIERSAAGRFGQDRAIVTEALAHECARMKARVQDYAGTRPEVREKLDRALAKGKEKNYVEFEQGSYKGVDYASCTQNALSLLNPALSQLQIFVPGSDVIVTVYLLEQKQARFKTIDEFLQLRRDFIEGYVDFLTHAGAPR